MTVEVIKAYVVPTITHSFIFGVDFVKEFDIVIEFSYNNWQIKSKTFSVSSFSSLPNPNTPSNNHCYSIDDLSPDRKLALEVVNSFKDIDSSTRRGRTNKIKMSLDTGSAKPFRKLPYLLSPNISKNSSASQFEKKIKLPQVSILKQTWIN